MNTRIPNCINFYTEDISFNKHHYDKINPLIILVVLTNTKNEKIIRLVPDLSESWTCDHSTADNTEINMFQESLEHIVKTDEKKSSTSIFIKLL